MTMIAIIGTAGRGAEQVDYPLYALMVGKAWEIIQRGILILISYLEELQ